MTTSMTPQTTAQAKEIEMGYDSGVPNSSLASRAWGYAVKYAPDCTELVIKQVAIYGNLYGQEHTGKICELKITDEKQAVLYETSFPRTNFAVEAKWLRISIPGIAVKSPFYVMFFTNSPQTNGVSVFYDNTPNQGSSLMDNWKTMEWPADLARPDKNNFNWMLRVTGASTDASKPITRPLPGKVASWKSMSFSDAVAALDTPEKVSASLLVNLTAESHYSTDPAATFFILTPQQVYEQGRGACNEFSVFACYVLLQHGYDANIFIIKVASNPERNHAVCLYRVNNQLYTINNGSIKGPFANFESIALNHDTAWSSYQIYYTWQKFQALGAPDTIVQRK